MNRKDRWDVILIGAGHNGLVAAALLAKAGRRVLVCERRGEPGGLMSVEEVWPEVPLPVGLHDLAIFSEKVIQDLGLESFGIGGKQERSSVTTLLRREGDPVVWGEEDPRSVIRSLSERDASRWGSFCQEVGGWSSFLARLQEELPPDLPALRTLPGLLHILKTGWRLRGLGKKGMNRLLRTLPMSLSDFLDEWFESESLKALLSAPIWTAQPQGPMAPGSAALFLLHHCGDGGEWAPRWRTPLGGMRSWVCALEACVKSFGAQIAYGEEVRSIVVEAEEVRGVVLADGTEHQASVVISGMDPRSTFLNLVGAPKLDPSFVQAVTHIRYRGSSARVQFLLSGEPQWKGLDREQSARVNRGRIFLGGGFEEIERASDAARLGQFDTKNLVAEAILPGLAVGEDDVRETLGMSVLVRFVPDRPDGGDWDGWAQKIGDSVTQELENRSSSFSEYLLDRRVLVPPDFERLFGVHEGHLHHGEMSLSQRFLMRPMPGWARYKTPIEGLFLCGSGCHPGGGLTGGPGRLAARTVLENTSARPR